MESLKAMKRSERKMLEPLTFEYEDEEVFGDVIPQTVDAQCKATSCHGAKTVIRQSSARSVHSASYADGNKFVFDCKEQCTTSNLVPSMGFKRKWSKRKKDLKLRYCFSVLIVTTHLPITCMQNRDQCRMSIRRVSGLALEESTRHTFFRI